MAITFRNAYSSGIIINQATSGTYDHLAFTSVQTDPSGAIQPVQVDTWAEAVYIVDDDANPYGGQWGGSASGQCTTTQYDTDTTCNVVRYTIDRAKTEWDGTLLSDINVFHPGNIDTYPTFQNESSGVLMIRYEASGVVYTYDTKLYATEIDGAIANNPSGIAVKGFEISPSGHKYNNYGYEWVSMSGNSPLIFADHSAESGWQKKAVHTWVAALSVSPTQIGTLNLSDFFFTVTYF